MATLPTRRPCPTNHRNTEEDRVRVVRDTDGYGKIRRTAWIIYRCRDCGQELEEPYAMRRTGERRAV